MKLEDQVVSLDLARKLKELGVKQEANFFWELKPHPNHKGPRVVSEFAWGGWHREYIAENCAAAFTVAELMFLLPQKFSLCRFYTDWEWRCVDNRKECEHIVLANTQVANNPADACAKMLIHLAEKGLIKFL